MRHVYRRRSLHGRSTEEAVVEIYGGTEAANGDSGIEQPVI
jgi:hypothetical protein